MSVTQQDITRWKNQGISNALISRWIANERQANAELRESAQRLAALAARRRGVAPGTPADASPAVIAQEAVCATCEGNGVYFSLSGELVPCCACGADKEVAQRRVRSLDKYSSGLSERTSAQTFANFVSNGTTAPLLTVSRQWAESPTGWLVIWGPPGSGKTHLCAATFNALRSRQHVCVFVTGPDLMHSLKYLMNHETAEAEGETVAQRTEKYQKAPILIIDDMRAEQRSEWSDGVWFAILDYRYRNRLPTMIVSNDDPAGDAFPARISSRLRDEHDGFSVVLRNTAKDMRVMA